MRVFFLLKDFFLLFLKQNKKMFFYVYNPIYPTIPPPLYYIQVRRYSVQCIIFVLLMI